MGALASEINNSLTALEIFKDSLYKIEYNVIFRDKSILPQMYLLSKSLSRFHCATRQVSSMIKSKVRKGHLEGVFKVQDIWNDKIIDGKVRTMNFSEFEAASKIKHCAFTRLNLVQILEAVQHHGAWFTTTQPGSITRPSLLN